MALTIATLLLALAAPGDATEAVQVEVPAPKVDVNPFRGHQLDGSGFVLPKKRWQIGFLETKYGIFDWLDVGTSPYPWLLGPILEGFSANLSAKVGFRTDHIAASFEARYLFLDVKQTEEQRSELTEERVSASVAPLTAALTWSPTDAISASFATRYVIVEASTDESRQSQEVAEGAAAKDALHLILSARWKLTKVLGLYARGYFEPWNENLSVNGQSQSDPRTLVSFNANIDTNEETGLKWSALGGVHLAFGNVNVRLGAGYGFYFAPVVGLVVPTESFIPDFDIYFRL